MTAVVVVEKALNPPPVEERCARGLALNDRAARLSARLGLLDRR